MTDIVDRLRDLYRIHDVEAASDAAEEILRLRSALESTQADLCNLQVAFNDWKVMHSTTRLEVELERQRQEWDRVHHVLAKHGLHPGRTDDRLVDVIDRALARLAEPPAVTLHAEPSYVDCGDCPCIRYVASGDGEPGIGSGCLAGHCLRAAGVEVK